jgi:hypothetical protein
MSTQRKLTLPELEAKYQEELNKTPVNLQKIRKLRNEILEIKRDRGLI